MEIRRLGGEVVDQFSLLVSGDWRFGKYHIETFPKQFYPEIEFISIFTSRAFRFYKHEIKLHRIPGKS